MYVSEDAKYQIAVKYGITTESLDADKRMIKYIEEKKGKYSELIAKYILKNDCIIMEAVNGTLDDLSSIYKKDMKNIVNILYEVIIAIKCLWDIGLAYTDIKMENIFYKMTNDGIRIILGDLGSISKIGESYTCTYFPPENRENPPTEKTISWGIGILILQLLGRDDIVRNVCYVYIENEEKRSLESNLTTLYNNEFISIIRRTICDDKIRCGLGELKDLIFSYFETWVKQSATLEVPIPIHVTDINGIQYNLSGLIMKDNNLFKYINANTDTYWIYVMYGDKADQTKKTITDNKLIYIKELGQYIPIMLNDKSIQMIAFRNSPELCKNFIFDEITFAEFIYSLLDIAKQLTINDLIMSDFDINNIYVKKDGTLVPDISTVIKTETFLLELKIKNKPSEYNLPFNIENIVMWNIGTMLLKIITGKTEDDIYKKDTNTENGIMQYVQYLIKGNKYKDFAILIGKMLCPFNTRLKFNSAIEFITQYKISKNIVIKNTAHKDILEQYMKTNMEERKKAEDEYITIRNISQKNIENIDENTSDETYTEITKMLNELGQAKNKYEKIEAEYKKANEEIEKANKEIEKAYKEIEKAYKEIEKAYKEIE